MMSSTNPKPHQLHQKYAQKVGQIRISVCSVSDSRSPKTDQNKFYLEDAIAAAGHRLISYHIVPDAYLEVQKMLLEFMESDCQIAIFNGGTGLSTRDRTFEAISEKIEKPVPGFGELFRMLSYREIGPAAMLSRAQAGVTGKLMVFSVPGSPPAVKLAWEKLIEPQLKHIVWELEK